MIRSARATAAMLGPRGGAAVLLRVLRQLDHLLEVADEAGDLEMPERSWARAEMVTPQPLPSSPRRFLIDADVVEEDFGEVRGAAHVLDRPHLDAGRVHLDEETGDALPFLDVESPG